MTNEPDLAHRLTAVREGVSDALAAADRIGEPIVTVVVTKFHPAGLVRELHSLGVRDFGESRHQDAREKAVELADLDLTWHFVGQLQGKKARQVQRYARVLHSVDRVSLAETLGDADPRTDVFVQVNLTEDPTRGGAVPADLEAVAERVLANPALVLRGVMAVAPVESEPRRAFAHLRELSDRVRLLDPTADRISAGMTNDFRDAILEGATHLRIGSAITGKRPERR
ncbi:YggS family pyridoxal phosphate-dependent enzyme [Planctomonas psychrotolerans]|uniref:YggS family pyridoxal phosphate-dependent enzyme n=1 Tax=Planctomonas psychrotolerans TaxID=2528712 RepID=UPI00123A6168|nr:YggS family pyridoxal phosphate-dependent enzyme [Planctomonas psychrotolerans]